MNRPKVNTLWRFTANLPGHDEIHKVIFARPEEVITIGISHSFLGNAREFAECFQFIAIPEKP